jgi:hypothetical protein
LVLRAAIFLFLAVPVAFVVTLALYPLWSWIEATFGIESVGHSGPADWTFLATYALLAITALSVLWRNWRIEVASAKVHERISSGAYLNSKSPRANHD